jgi:hypothetical protein
MIGFRGVPGGAHLDASGRRGPLATAVPGCNARNHPFDLF